MSALTIATDGPCAGHLCDHCHICQRGRCCRHDNPDYQLPQLGEWDGPIYGELGVLADDGDKAECHCCGNFYGHLGNHVWRAHNLTADEYRAIFGLRASTGLIGPTLFAKRSAAASSPAHKAFLAEMGKAHAANWTPEQRSAWARGRAWSLESRQDPELAEARKEWNARGKATLRARVEAGEYVYPAVDPAHIARMRELATDALAAMLADPERKAAWAQKISAARGGQRELVCPICGTTVLVDPSAQKVTCGDPACTHEWRSRKMKARWDEVKTILHSPEVRAKQSARAKARDLIRDEHGRIVGWDRGTAENE